MEESPENSSTVREASGSYEESGWTQYLVDFQSFNGEDSDYSTCFGGSSSLLVSDVATGGHRTNLTAAGNCFDACSFVVDRPRTFPKKLRFKKSRREEITDQDDSLEDTASSPINSPKVGGIDHKRNMPSTKIFSHFNHPPFQAMGQEENFAGGQEEEKRRMNFTVKNDDDLRNRDIGFSVSVFVSHQY